MARKGLREEEKPAGRLPEQLLAEVLGALGVEIQLIWANNSEGIDHQSLAHAAVHTPKKKGMQPVTV